MLLNEKSRLQSGSIPHPLPVSREGAQKKSQPFEAHFVCSKSFFKMKIPPEQGGILHLTSNYRLVTGNFTPMSGYRN